MWGTASASDKLTGDFGNRLEGISTGDCRLFRHLAENWSHGIFGLLQHNRSKGDMAASPRDVRFSNRPFGVSFVMKRAAGAGRKRGIAVVDVWMQSGENSVLKTRYAAFQHTRSLRVPGETRQQQIDKRY
jgi:hypothetical protein